MHLPAFTSFSVQGSGGGATEAGGGGREKERENSKTLILKDSSVRPIWTYLTASPCYTTNTNKHDNTTNIISTIKQWINAVSQRQTDRQTDRHRDRESK